MVDLNERHELLYTSSPIAALPIEILSLVFHEVQRTRRATGKPMIPHVEITLSHVCRHWRAVALSLPSMWCVFQHSYAPWYGPVRPTRERLAVYLERSGDHPFDFWIDFKTNEPVYQWLLFPLLEIALPHLHRFRVLHLLSNANHSLKEFAEQLAGASVPLLEICAICPDNNRTHEFKMASLVANKANIFRSGAPSLKYLRIDETSMCGFLPPLNAIVHLRIEVRRTALPTLIPNTAFDAIVSLPNLETLSHSSELFELQEYSGSVPKEPIRANKLKHFRSANILITIYALSHVVAPSLESITINGVDSVNEDGQLSIPNHVAFPSLRIVAFTRGRLNSPRHGPNLQKLMACMLNVEELLFWGKTRDQNATEDTFRALLGTDSAPSPWEKIKKATLNIPFSSPTEILLYHQFIAAKPNLEVLRVPPRCLELPTFLQGVPPHIDLRAIDESEPPLPLCWVPGPDWLDTEEDPFLSYCRVFE
ncbi:hypothetical protein D9611_004076 [Ephemerocybe angulata]|uniref:F-box domain-containing protein n=1 Tax=Ephemerocybe angulata TaxID=980116 RepID=A0A8H5BKM0_9AGAR|nr:hypothetical protein D9611_004076 [Tulosesus angulatus]